ncbi:MAG TPA: glycogen synthase GlgA [Vicinamibacterales bacterium]
MPTSKDSKEPAKERKPRRRETATQKKPAKPAAPKGGDPLDILMVTSEARPFAKTGGLADVSGALPRALARLGHRVTIVLPRYRGTNVSASHALPADVPLGVNKYPVRFIEQPLDEGVTAILVDAPALYDRDGLYGDARGAYTDNAFRYAVLCRGALEYARMRGRRPSVIHAHDWQGAFTPIYARTALHHDPIVGGVRTVLTIHNLAFQGQFDPAELTWIGISRDLYHPGLLEFWGRASSLKGGILLSDVITTVSPTYAREIVTPEYGFGFNGILRDRAADLIGILNGIDVEAWDPATDRLLPVHFGPATLDQKPIVKRTLLEYVNLPSDESALARPVIGLVTRLTTQKGCDLMAAAADRMMSLDASWVMLGSGDRWCEDLWRSLAERRPRRVAAVIGFDERLAHLIEGGADMFLMPSWYEPCGLNQMYSQRYGTLPIVRATGGLVDSVIDADESPKTGTGFKFRDYNSAGLMWGMDRALKTFGDPARWRQLQRNAMKQDFSWDVSAREYVKVYRGQKIDGIRQGTDDHGRQLRPDDKRRKTRAR